LAGETARFDCRKSSKKRRNLKGLAADGDGGA
jgi:hypothetical protein